MMAGSALLLVAGCGRAERWVSEKADEALAHEIESAVDELAEGKNHPSGVPNRRKKSNPLDGASSASAAEASAPTPLGSSAAQPIPGP